MCVSVHSALSMVSQAVRDLLVRYPAFKTTHVLLPASQLIHSVKGKLKKERGNSMAIIFFIHLKFIIN